MRKEDFEIYPEDGPLDDDGYHTNTYPDIATRCYFEWGFHPSPALEHWTHVSISLHGWKGMTNEFKDWCCENINTRWTCNSSTRPGYEEYDFEDEATAFLFKLTWA